MRIYRMGRFNKVIDGILFYILALALAALVGVGSAQVVARYIFSAAFTWAEEVSIIILLWSAWGAACLAIGQNAHLRVRILEDRLGDRGSRILRLFLYGLAIPFLVVVIFAGKTFLDASSFMTLMSLPTVPVSIMYLSVPVGCILMIYYLIRAMIEDVKHLKSNGGEDI